MADRIIPKGQDFLHTVRSDQFIELSPDLLGDKMKTFGEFVTLIGAPLALEVVVGSQLAVSKP